MIRNVPCRFHHVSTDEVFGSLGDTGYFDEATAYDPSSPYSASKAALESLTRTWAAEFGPSGIRVNSVAPGPTRTEGVEAEWGETNEQLGRSMPLGRTASPDEIAQAVLFLASPRATFITGSVLHADGGGSAI